MGGGYTISLPYVSITYIFIIPEGIPGVPAVVVVNICHVVLTVDAYRLPPTSVRIAVTIDVDSLKFIRNREWFKIAFLCKCISAMSFRK